MAPRDTLAPQVRRLDFCKASHSFRPLGAGPHPIHVSHCRRHDCSPIEQAGNSGVSSQHLSPQLDNYPEFNQYAAASLSSTVPRNKAKYGDDGVVFNSFPSIRAATTPEHVQSVTIDRDSGGDHPLRRPMLIFRRSSGSCSPALVPFDSKETMVLSLPPACATIYLHAYSMLTAPLPTVRPPLRWR